MAISTTDVLRSYYNARNVLGAPSINSDATFEIEGYEHLLLNTKQFPWPTLGVAGEIEAPGPMGSTHWEAQQLKTAQQGPITFTETVSGSVMQFMEDIVAGGGKFNANVYEGTPDRFVRGYKLVSCFYVPDQTDRDWENRSQLTLINGTLFFHYYGQKLTANATSL